MRAAIQRFWCRLLRHRHGQAYILCTTTDGVALKSHEMDYWSAEWIVVNTRRFDLPLDLPRAYEDDRFILYRLPPRAR